MLQIIFCHPSIETQEINICVCVCAYIVSKRAHGKHFKYTRVQSNVIKYMSPTGLPSRGGDVVVYVKDIHQPILPIPFYSVLVPISVGMALSTVFHSINFPNNFLLSRSVLPVLILP